MGVAQPAIRRAASSERADRAERSSGRAERLIGIEILRFISAFAILIWHYQYFAFTAEGVVIERNEQPFYGLLAPLYRYGGLGVHVFWCISGLIFFFKYFEAVRAGRVSGRTFAWNRFTRLYPLHVLTLAVVAVLQAAFVATHGFAVAFPFNDLEHFALNVLFVSGWGFESGYSFNGPIWSVSMELIAYAAFFVLVSRLSLGWTYVGAVALFAAFAGLGKGQIAQCLMYFFIGGAIALCRFFPQAIAARAWLRERLFGLLGVAIAAANLAAAGWVATGTQRFASEHLFRTCLVTALVYACVWAGDRFVRFERVGTFLGNLTYASYLTHFPIQLAMLLLFTVLGLTVDIRSPALLISFLVIVLGVAAVVYRTVEMPIQRALRRRFA